MVRRLLGLLLLLLAPFDAGEAMAQPSQRIVAVGDLHGDWEAWQAIARAAGLIDARGRWSGGAATLVQLGDVPDRGPDTLKIIRHLQSLQRQAARKGGRVIALVGNHEAMNVIGDLRYVHPGEYRAFATSASARLRERYFEANRANIAAQLRRQSPDLSDAQVRDAYLAATPLGMIEHRLAWAPDGEVGRWVLGNPTVVKLGDTLLVHGGLSAEYGALPLAEINRRVADDLRRREQAPSSILSDPLGPLWYRGNVARGTAAAGGDAAPAPAQLPAARPSIEAELDGVLRTQGAVRLVIGHTPSLAGVQIDHGGKLVRADTGISRHYGGTLGWVEIVGGKVVARSVARPGTGGGR
jgi:hypothetical protein